MQSLTHTYLVLNLVRGDGLNRKQENDLILGSIIPDISELGWGKEKHTHRSGWEFLKAHPKYPYFALGMITHGENPRGLDYYTHNPKGYLARKKKKVLEIIHRYPECWAGLKEDAAVHKIIEFSVESLIGEKNKGLIRRVNNAFRSRYVRRPVQSFSNFSKVNPNLCYALDNEHLQGWFKSFKNTPTAAALWLNLISWRKLKGLPTDSFWNKLRLYLRFSYFYVLNLLTPKQRYIRMFTEVKQYLRKDYLKFLDDVKKKLIKTKIEVYTYAKEHGKEDDSAKRSFQQFWHRSREKIKGRVARLRHSQHR